MELKKQILKQNIQKGKAFTQVTLDDDCIVKDSKPDIIKIIHTKGSIIFEESFNIVQNSINEIKKHGSKITLLY